MKKILVLGCTGSIGSQTLDIVRHNPADFMVAGLSAGHNAAALRTLCEEFHCPGTLFSSEGYDGLKRLIEGSHADMAVNGIAGAAGLYPSVFALEAGMDLALANKESVVMAWPVIAELAAAHHAHIIPVDSEHSAIFALRAYCGDAVSEIIITASGGPFRDYSIEQLRNVTVEQALRHPTWNMGKKITIDSASLANKGLEVIEACRLFHVPPAQVQVVVHPQSLIHSLVRTQDGMLYAQISDPDMRHPIWSALTWPHNEANYLRPFTLAGQEMSFFPPRLDAFPLLRLAYRCAEQDAAYTIAFNAANEIAVDAFLHHGCSFVDISAIVEAVVEQDWQRDVGSIEKIMDADAKARNEARQKLVSLHGDSK